jgi:Up-frameshift suppressor 2
MMHFALVTRGKGNKAQVKQIEVPVDASIAIRSKERQRAEEEERGRVREHIMKMTQ